MLVLDADLRVKSGNAAFFRVFQFTQGEVLKYVYELGDSQWDIPALRTLLSEILPQKRRLDNFRVQHEFSHTGLTTMLLIAKQVIQGNGEAPLILLAIDDISARYRAKEALRDANRDLQHFAYAASHNLHEPLPMVTSSSQWLKKNLAGKLNASSSLLNRVRSDPFRERLYRSWVPPRWC